MAKAKDGKKIADLFIKTCLGNGIPLLEAYLFGSYVNETSTEYSDIDVALVADCFGKNIIENAKLTALINYKFPDVEIHHFSHSEFITDEPFVNEIKRTGIKIY